MDTVLIGTLCTFVTHGLENWKSEVKVTRIGSFVAFLQPVTASFLWLPLVPLCLGVSQSGRALLLLGSP